MDASIIVALIAGAISIAGMVGNFVKDRRTRQEKVRTDERLAFETQPDRAVARMVSSLAESEKQTEWTAKRLEERSEQLVVTEKTLDEVRVRFREVIERNEDLEHDCKRLRESNHEVRLENEELKRELNSLKKTP